MTQLQQLELMKRMAWVNIQNEIHPPERPQDANDRKALTKAMYMLAYLGAIDMAIYDLIDELTEAGLYKHHIKHTIGRVSKTVSTANGLANNILKAVNNGERVRQYADMYEYAYNKIQRSVAVEAPNRAYSIIKALSRLFIEAYNEVGARTNHRYLGDVAKILPRIDIPQLEDKNIDCIIRSNVQIELASL